MDWFYVYSWFRNPVAPPVLYERCREKWNILHINWWSTDIRTTRELLLGLSMGKLVGSSFLKHPTGRSKTDLPLDDVYVPCDHQNQHSLTSNKENLFLLGNTSQNLGELQSLHYGMKGLICPHRLITRSWAKGPVPRFFIMHDFFER